MSSSPPDAGARAEVGGRRAVREEVREFLAAELAAGTFTTHVDTWLSGVDPAFSRSWASAAGWA